MSGQSVWDLDAEPIFSLRLPSETGTRQSLTRSSAHDGADRPESDGQPTISFVGTIHGREELRRALGKATTNDGTDAQLVLAAYRAWGPDAPKHLLGDYAFSILDPGAARVLLVRDAMGIVPLFYVPSGGQVFWSTSSLALARNVSEGVRLNEAAVASYLVGRLDHTSSLSMYAGVSAVPAGHTLVVRTGSPPSLRRYWSMEDVRSTTLSFDDSADRLRWAIDTAVADRLSRTVEDSTPSIGSADGVIDPAGHISGALVSGGLDSCALVPALAAHAGSRARALSWNFGALTNREEIGWARATCEQHDTQLHVIDASEHPPALDFFIRYTHPDDPMQRRTDPLAAAAFNRMRTFRNGAQPSGNILLTGDGGDALFGGSAVWYAERARGFHAPLGAWRALRDARFRPRTARHWLAAPKWASPAHELAASDAVSRVPSWIRQDVLDQYGARAYPSGPSAARPLDGLARPLHQWRIERGLQIWMGRQIRRLASRSDMTLSMPYADRRLIELSLSTPPEYHWRAGQNKRLLRRAMKDLLSDDLLARTDKSHVSGYFDLALRPPRAQEFLALFERPISEAAGFVDGPKLREAFSRAAAAGRFPGDLWLATTLEIWLRRHMPTLNSDK